MTLHEKHMKLIDDVNCSTVGICHGTNLVILAAWRMGVEDAGVTVNLIAADHEQIARGVTRPMCAGVFLDWVETSKTAQATV